MQNAIHAVCRFARFVCDRERARALDSVPMGRTRCIHRAPALCVHLERRWGTTRAGGSACHLWMGWDTIACPPLHTKTPSCPLLKCHLLRCHANPSPHGHWWPKRCTLISMDCWLLHSVVLHCALVWRSLRIRTTYKETVARKWRRAVSWWRATRDWRASSGYWTTSECSAPFANGCGTGT